MEKQKAKLIADKEKKAKEEEEKRKKEEEKAKKEKEFRERNDKARCSLNFDQNISVNFNDYSRDKFANFISNYEDRGSISEEQDVNILMDLSSRKGSIVISGFEEEMITSQFPNCILYENNSIYKHKIFEDNTIKNSKIVYPVKQGNFYDYALLELLIDCAYHEKIRLAPEECGIIFTEPINCFKEDREKIAQIFFEDYNIPKLFIIKPTVLTLLSEGKYTGIVAQLDDDVSNFVPVFDCFKLDKASIRSDFGRKDLIDYMETLLNDKYYFITNYNKSVIEKIVGECYVALNYEKELYNLEEFNYLLPDGKEISIKEQRIKCPEILINPSNYFKDTNNENKSIVKNIDNSIKKCDEDKQKDLYNNIYLTGINSNFGGLKERVKLELENLKSYSSNYDIQVFNNSQGIEKGVENFFSNKAFEGMWITKEEYEEEGSTVVNKKFQ
jgi:actin-related protein